MDDSITARRADTVAAKQAQIVTPPSLCLTVCMRCLCWDVVFIKHSAMHNGQSSQIEPVQRTLFHDIITQSLVFMSTIKVQEVTAVIS